MTPEVTVVVPTRNRRAMLSSTLAAVLAQRDVDLHVVVVDEASTDDTPQLLAALADPRVTSVRHDEPRGAAGARNAGVRAARAPWVAFCDDDDLWAPDKLRAQLDALAGAPECRWAACGSVVVDESLDVVDHQRVGAGGDVLGRLCVANDIPGGGSGVLVAVDLVREAGEFSEQDRNSEDWDLWVRLAALSSLAVVDRPLVAYRVWAGSKSRSVERMIDAYDRITTRYAHLAQERGVRPDVVAHRRYLAKQLLRSGQRRGSVALFVELARRHGWRGGWLRVPPALVSPRLFSGVSDRRSRARVPAAWRAEVASWLPAAGQAGVTTIGVS